MNFGWNAYKLMHWYPHTGTSVLSKDSNIETKIGNDLQNIIVNSFFEALPLIQYYVSDSIQAIIIC